MKLDKALILSAGFGTRMGEAGVLLPKPLWPIFNKRMLDVHILRLRDQGISKIYINTHHCSDLIQNFIDEQGYDFVECLFEAEILGSGGAIHNLKKEKQLCGPLLILNADAFLFMKSEELEIGAKSIEERDLVAHLFSVTVEEKSNYNRLKIFNQSLVDIIAPGDSGFNQTYSGVGIINLDKMSQGKGYSSLFESVANFRERPVGVSCPENYEYWDFGTRACFIDSHFKLLEHSGSEFLDFLENIGAYNKDLNFRDSYNCDQKGVIDLKKRDRNESFDIMIEDEGKKLVFN